MIFSFEQDVMLARPAGIGRADIHRVSYCTMPTILSHVAVPLALGIGLGRKTISVPLLVAGVLASVVPDLDVLAFRFGVRYADAFGHRGASHSLAFALVLGVAAFLLARRLSSTRCAAFAFVCASALSHGLLDMLTNGGLGVALWWPASPARLFFPWHGIEVSPLSLRRFASGRGFAVLKSELLRVWLPAAVSCGVLLMARGAISWTERTARGKPDNGEHVER